jgi:hypothetical protein
MSEESVKSVLASDHAAERTVLHLTRLATSTNFSLDFHQVICDGCQTPNIKTRFKYLLLIINYECEEG